MSLRRAAFLSLLWLCMGVAPVSFSGCGEQRSSDPLPAAAQPPRKTGSDPLVDQLRQLVVERRFTTLPLECLEFVRAAVPASDTLQVDVREKHGGGCGGDPNTAPRLFSLEVDMTSGSVATDAGSLTGEMRILANVRIAH